MFGQISQPAVSTISLRFKGLFDFISYEKSLKLQRGATTLIRTTLSANLILLSELMYHLIVPM
uniref:Putative ovule protein n=1 Tax=Solanum chacoense TaxID=4108 RepID=A0A0V0I5L9_SOLCH